MHPKKPVHLTIAALGLALMLGLTGRARPVQAAQDDQCGVVSTIGFPVDRSVFQIGQDFGALSDRHLGIFHTGEDLYGGRGTSFGQPVHAIAAGRVTYSSPVGWGVDKGVVIIQHTFPDGSVAYSMYGHMQETDTVKFPPRLTCVQAGQIIGTVGDVRPAPHLHFEIRVNQPDVPGSGYTEEYPTLLGWRHPDQFVLNWQTWLLPSQDWHADLTDNLVSAPLVLSDGSMMALTPTRLRGLTPDGRILWRVSLDKPPAALSWLQDTPLLTNADGSMETLNADGTVIDRWDTGVALDGDPLTLGDLLLFHTPDNTLVAFSADRKSVAWQLPNVPPLVRAYAAPNLIGLITTTNQILSVSPEGQLLNQAQLTEPASMSSAPDGNLLVYSAGGLWEVDNTGTWALAIENAPPGGETSGVLFDASGARYYLSANPPTLYALDTDNAPLWQAQLAGIAGEAQISLHDKVLLLTTNEGNIVTLQAATGALCNSARLYGDRSTTLWPTLGADGVLRVAIGNEVVGFDWKKFIGGCA